MAGVDLTVNGQRRRLDVSPSAMLVDVLRGELGLTGTKPGCREGACGSCTVLMDGRAVRSCLVKAAQASGRRIVTIEGLATPGGLHPLQQAFLDNEAFQCGYCTPGMIMGAAALLSSNNTPGDGDIAGALQPHLCRCGTQPRIVAAVKAAAEVMRRG